MHEQELQTKSVQIDSGVSFKKGPKEMKNFLMPVSFSQATQSLPSIISPSTACMSVSMLMLNTHIKYSTNYSDTS